jgi:endonuclease/exonuclease/phosphatase family metal-dependent hydrolase
MVLTRVPSDGVERLPTNFQSWLVSTPDPANGLTLTVVAAHPTAPVAPTGAPLWRADHASLLGAATLASADLVLGDLNATVDHAVLRDWFEAGYRDSLEMVNAGLSPTWPSNGITPVPGLSVPSLFQLDHVLVGPRLAVTSSRTVEIPGTDHRAVLAAVAPR